MNIISINRYMQILRLCKLLVEDSLNVQPLAKTWNEVLNLKFLEIYLAKINDNMHFKNQSIKLCVTNCYSFSNRILQQQKYYV